MLTTYELYNYSRAEHGEYDARTIALRKDFEDELALACGQAQTVGGAMPYTTHVPEVTIKDQRTNKELVEAALAPDKTSTDAERVELFETFAEETLPKTNVDESVEQYEANISGEDEDELAEPVYTQSQLRFQRVAEQMAEKERVAEEAADKYPMTGGWLLKRPMSALEREWYDAVQRYGADDPITRELGAKVTEQRLRPLTEESVIPFMRRKEGDTGLFAPPPKSLEEREGGLLDTLIAPLLISERAVGTVVYELRKKLGLGGIDWIEQAEEGETFKEISPSMALGITTRETDLFTARGLAGIALDIGLDPLTYTGVGTVYKGAGVIGKGIKAVRIANRQADTAVVGKEAADMLARQVEGLHKAFPNAGTDEVREAAESIVYEQVKKHPELLAAKKYVEPSVHIFGRPLAYTKPITRQLGKVWEAAPYLKKRTAAVETARTWFRPFHKVKEAAGERAAEVFAKFYRATEYQRGEWGKRAAKLAGKRQWFVKRSSEQEFNKQVRQYLERGVEPPDPRALEEALEIRKGYDEMFEKEVEAGLITEEQKRPDYMFHVLTPDAKKFLKEQLGSEFKEGEEAYTYVRKLESAHKREYTGTIDEMNKIMRKEHKIDEFFVEDPLKAYFMRGVQSSRAIESFKLDKAIKTGTWTKDVEELAPVAGRTTQKFTDAAIKEKAAKKYGADIEKLRTQIEIPEEGRISTIEDVMQYAQREVTDEDLLKSIDEQILETEAKLEAGIWRAEDGVLGAKPKAVTAIQQHLTKPAREAKEKLVDLRAEREFIRTGGKREEAITAFDVETAEMYAKKSDEYLVEAGEHTTEARHKLEDAIDRLDELKSSKKLQDDYLADTLKKTTDTKAYSRLMDETFETIETKYEMLGEGRRTTFPALEEVLPPAQLKKYERDVDKFKDLFADTEPIAKDFEAAQEILAPYKTKFAQRSMVAGTAYGKAAADYERLSKLGVPVDEIPVVKKQSEKVEKLESLLKTAEDIESEYAGAAIGIERGTSIETILEETDVPKLTEFGEGRTTKRIAFAIDLDERLSNAINIIDEAIATKTKTVEAGAVLPTKTAEYRKLVGKKDDLISTREQINDFYEGYSSLSPDQLTAEAKRISKLPGIAGEDKKVFADIADGVNLLEVYAKQSDYVTEMGQKTMVSAPPKEVIVRTPDGKAEPWDYNKDFGTYVPRALTKEIEETVPVEDMWTRYYDPAMSLIRKGYIGYWPAFYVRNIYSAAWQNVYRRVGVEDYAAAIATKYGDPEALIDLGPMYGKVPAKELKEMMERQGVTGQIGFVDVPEAFMETGAIGGLSLTKGIQTAETSMQYAMKTTEDLARMPLYIKTMRQGGSPEQAAEAVRKFQFEYGAAGLTTFEKRKMKRLFLFYTWFRKNIPLQTEMIAEQPGTFAAAFKTREMMITPEEYNELDDWAKEGFAVGGPGDKYYMMDVPITDLPGLYGREELWFGVSGFAKISMAMALGYDPSTKQPLETPEDWGDLFASTFVGRYKSLYKEMGKVGEEEIAIEDFAVHQLGGMYVGQYKGLSAKEAMKSARLYERKASEEDYIAAFEAAGVYGAPGEEVGAAYYETVWKPERLPRGEVFTKEKKWYEQLAISSAQDIDILHPTWGWAPWNWGQKEEYIGEDVVVIGYTAEQEAAIAGHRLTDDQKDEVKRIYEEEGAQFAAGYRTMMALEYHEARAMIVGKEPVSPEAITESLMKLRARVGEEESKKAKIRTLYTTEGKPHVVALTEQEAEDWGEWRPPQELIDWLYPETEEEIYKMPLAGYEKYIETKDPDYLLTPKEKMAKRGKEVSWELERATAKVKEIKAAMDEGAEPTQELIGAEEELRAASEEMAQYFGEEASEYDIKFFEYLQEAEKSGIMEEIGIEKAEKYAAEYAEMQTGIPSPVEHPTTRPVATEIMDYLQDMYEETGFVPSEAQMGWATRETEGVVILTKEDYETEQATLAAMSMDEYEHMLELGHIKPTRMLITDQMDIFEAEYGAEQEQDRLMREELIGLREDPVGKTRSQKDIPAALMLTLGAQDIQTRISRTEELENLLGVGVDR